MIVIARIIIQEFYFLFLKFCHYLSMLKYLYSKFTIIREIKLYSDYYIYS